MLKILHSYLPFSCTCIYRLHPPFISCKLAAHTFLSPIKKLQKSLPARPAGIKKIVFRGAHKNKNDGAFATQKFGNWLRH